MNKTLTSREAILSVGKEIVIQFGLQTLNIRDVAHKCGVSVGSVYNYFPSKSDLVVATTEAVWADIMQDAREYVSQRDFSEHIQSLFQYVKQGCEKYPSFFSVHSMSIANMNKEKGRQAMNQYFAHMRMALLQTLEQDTNVRKDAFSETFTKEDFVAFVFSNFVSLLLKQAQSCAFLLEIVKRAIY